MRSDYVPEWVIPFEGIFYDGAIKLAMLGLLPLTVHVRGSQLHQVYKSHFFIERELLLLPLVLNCPQPPVVLVGLAESDKMKLLVALEGHELVVVRLAGSQVSGMGALRCVVIARRRAPE